MKGFIRDTSESFGINTNNESPSIDIYFAGCSMEPKCKECHNPELWEAKYKDECSDWDIIFAIYEAFKTNTIKTVVLLGGEPLDQPEFAVYMAKYAHYLGMTIWLYTGKTYEYIPFDVAKHFDVVVAGRYMPEHKNEAGFPASKNQVVVRRYMTC